MMLELLLQCHHFYTEHTHKHIHRLFLACLRNTMKLKVLIKILEIILVENMIQCKYLHKYSLLENIKFIQTLYSRQSLH